MLLSSGTNQNEHGRLVPDVPFDHGKDINLPHVKFATPAYVIRRCERPFYEWTSLNHLKNVLSCVNCSYHLPFRLHSNTWWTASLTHSLVNRVNTPLDGILRSGKRLWYSSTAARALPLQNLYTKCMSQYSTWENTKGIFATAYK